MVIEKYRVHELAKDLGVPSREIVELLDKYFPGNTKKHMASLNKQELNVIFQHYTQEHEVENIDKYFEESRKIREKQAKEEAKEEQASKQEKPAPKKKAAPKKETPKKAEKPAAKKPEPKKQEPKKQKLQTTQLPQGQKKEARPAVKQTVEQEDGQTRVDIRASDVNLDRYNERYEKIAQASTDKRDTAPKKQKFPKATRSRRQRRQTLSRREK